jgi:hypothetical protein
VNTFVVQLIKPNKFTALAGRKRSRRGGDAGVTDDESALADALSASTQQIYNHLARSEVQRAERNETSPRRVLVLERELEVRKVELLLGPASSATEQENGMARTLLLSMLQKSAEPPDVDAGGNGTASASPATLDARYSRSRTYQYLTTLTQRPLQLVMSRKRSDGEPSWKCLD